MSLDPKQVKHIATLARLKVADSELPGLANELNGIMTWIEVVAAPSQPWPAPAQDPTRHRKPRRHQRQARPRRRLIKAGS